MNKRFRIRIKFRKRKLNTIYEEDLIDDIHNEKKHSYLYYIIFGCWL